MKKVMIISLLCQSIILQGFSQSTVGIGTTTPNPKAILDLSSTSQVLLPPRMNTTQMKAISSPPVGGIIYNTDVDRYMSYTTTHVIKINTIIIPSNKWLPVSAGPKVLAWGSVDSTTGSGSSHVAPVNSGSGNFTITWFKEKNGGPTNWYELALTNDNFSLDSMILSITPVGNGSWDVTVATGEVVVADITTASIKFVDISRSVAGWSSIDIRRRSKFHFVLYDMRGY